MKKFHGWPKRLKLKNTKRFGRDQCVIANNRHYRATNSFFGPTNDQDDCFKHANMKNTIPHILDRETIHEVLVENIKTDKEVILDQNASTSGITETYLNINISKNQQRRNSTNFFRLRKLPNMNFSLYNGKEEQDTETEPMQTIKIPGMHFQEGNFSSLPDSISPPSIDIPKCSMEEVANNIINYSEKSKLPEIFFLLEDGYLIKNHISALGTKKYFLILKNLIKIENKILDYFQKNIENFDLSAPQGSILLQLPVFIAIKKAIEERKNLAKSDIKNYVTVFFGLQGIESYIKYTDKEVKKILNAPKATDSCSINRKLQLSLVLYTNISLESSLVYFRNHLIVSSGAINNISDKISPVLLAVMFYFDEEEITEIYTLYGSFNTSSSSDSKFLNKKEQEKTIFSNHLIFKIIKYYFDIFDTLYMKKPFKFSSFASNQTKYESLKKRFDRLSKDEAYFKKEHTDSLIFLLEKTHALYMY
ncbi:hypothetical protein CWI36_0138p0050 [Hamiltosporidium magnivora]|uniref:Uncharacterized protein n=1 Tax=Hamiltosporidium magnivora TaxID=148818 RepID=A0A4Q9LM22_9MICR|nr:hypothetical protein CWI36_0138p0050 [Hamiltosporidium magnivora]